MGDVVAILHGPSGRLLVHRVVERRGAAVVIKGDNCRVPDGEFPGAAVIGRVACIERRGRPVGGGLGAERALVAAASRTGALLPLTSLARRVARPRRRREHPLDIETRAVLACAQAVIDEHHIPVALDAVAACASAERLSEVAAEHHMLGHLERLVRVHGAGIVSPDLRERLTTRQRHTAAHLLIQTGALLEIVQELTDRGIRVMPIKGPVWGERLYGDPVLRSWGDLDLLMPREQVPPARDVLLEAGYRDDHPCNQRLMQRAWRAEGAIHLTSADNALHVDLHWQVSPGYGASGVPAEDFLTRAEPHTLLGREILGPAPADLVIMTCLHGARHRWSSLDAVLGLGMQVRAEAVAWASVLSTARAHGSRRRVIVGVAHACRVLGLPRPRAVEEALAGDRRSQALLASLRPDSLERHGSLGARERLVREAWRIRGEDSGLGSVTHLSVQLLRPGPEDWEAGLGAWSPRLAYATRPVRLTRKWVGRLAHGAGLRDC